MAEPTKADLADAVARLTEENAALRDLLAAIREAAGAVPVSAGYDRPVLNRARSILGVIEVCADVEGEHGTLNMIRGGADTIRHRAAEPLGYEAYAPASVTA